MKSLTCCVGILLLSTIVPMANLSSQIVWQKHSANPVLPYWSGDVDDPNGYKYTLNPSVVYQETEKIYRMWFTSLAFGYGTSFVASEAISFDASRWYVYAKNPVLRPGPSGSFDSRLIRNPSIVVDEDGYKLYYTGYNEQRYEIGLATSTDGKVWTKHPANPILRVGASGMWDAVHVLQPTVVCKDGFYRMWYSGYNGTTWAIGFATSTDGISWTKYPFNPVLTAGTVGSFDADGVIEAGVVLVDNTYHMIYTGMNNQTQQLGYAYSTHGTVWQKYAGNPVLSPGNSGSWDDRHIGTGALLFHDNKFHLWYTANNYQTGWWQVGYATAPRATTSPLEEDVPQSFGVSQSYPNPSNPTTTIRYELPEESHVKITVFNALGQEVAVLFDGTKPAGLHSVDWRTPDTPSGAYWYRAEFTGSTGRKTSETKKLIILK